YGESLNGVQTRNARKHQFHFPVDPYIVPGDPASGLLPRIHGESPGEEGSGDHRVQAYCFRTCMTDHPENRVPWPKPDGYDPQQYELLLRYLQAGWKGVFSKFDPIPNRKTDTNNHGAFSFDNIGANYEYPEGSYEKRREIIREHERYQKGLLWFLANDPRVPDDIATEIRRWGLARDEFTDNGNWPHQIYVREARRMVSDFVVTELHLRRKEPTPRPVGMGSYNMDSHNVQRYVDADGHARNEGDIQISPGGPYPIDYGAIVPKKKEAPNLLVPVCVSSSHIAYGSIRMEPVFMILGQSAATAACLALDLDLAVQDLPYPALRKRLLADRQVLETPNPAGFIPLRSLRGIVVDNTRAQLEGPWKKSGVTAGVHDGYLHDDGAADSSCLARFTADLDPGFYDIEVAYTPHPNRATNVPIRITASREVHRFSLNQREKPNHGAFHTLDSLFLGGPTTVLIANRETDGHTIVDAVRFLKK
ncbi:MAG: FAD-dependent oxidoreductase, partial [Akkermansiaceae bacterium]|nr:FAD-dependent oxidoreductase [Akkermansiaceae bacterium]